MALISVSLELQEYPVMGEPEHTGTVDSMVIKIHR